MTHHPAPSALARDLERSLRARGATDRAAGAKAYLKSDLEFVGVDTPTLRKAVKGLLRDRPGLDRVFLGELVEALWRRGIFELRAAVVELLIARVDLLEPGDMDRVERLLRDSHTWALVDGLAPRVAGPLACRYPELEASLDHWAEDDDFWLRRSSLDPDAT